MNNLSPQYPKVPAWSQLRARVRSAWNDLFYSDRPQQEKPTPNTRSGFTLRKLFAAVWPVAAIAFAAREDLETVFAVGAPLAVLGYVYLSGLRLGCFVQGVLWSWLILGWFFCYYLPYQNTPLPLPASAHHVRWSSGWSHVYFRFEAPVNACIDAAEQHLKKSRYPERTHGPEIIDRTHGLGLPHDGAELQRGHPWMDMQNINKGLHYRANYIEDIWIDTERGIFYFRWYD